MTSSYFLISAIKIILLMSLKKEKHYYNTPLNTSKTIDLPSNLLQMRPSNRYQDIPIAQTIDLTPRTPMQALKPEKDKNIMFVQQKVNSRKSVLYKRLSDIKNKNDELQKYSYSKLLSKMVVVDPKGPQLYKTLDGDIYNKRSISEYSCLRGKMMNMTCDEEERKTSAQSKQRLKVNSSIGEYANRTTRIFKRFYMPNSQKVNPLFFNQSSPEQKYIYINGKKTECKRIHNFYTSQNFRNSYDKAFGKTKQSFYTRKANRN